MLHAAQTKNHVGESPHGPWRAVAERALALCCCRAERAFRGAHQLGKQCVAFLRELREHLAIDLDPSLLQAVHQAAVRDAVLARERIDTSDPQRSELALLLLAITIGIGQA